jgi:hypothetical protein
MKIFNTTVDHFDNQEDYEVYMERCRYAVCHEKLQIGEEFDLKPIQTPEETGSLTVQAVIVHKKCYSI